MEWEGRARTWSYSVIMDGGSYAQIIKILRENSEEREALRDWQKKVFKKWWKLYQKDDNFSKTITLCKTREQFANFWKIRT